MFTTSLLPWAWERKSISYHIISWLNLTLFLPLLENVWCLKKFFPWDVNYGGAGAKKPAHAKEISKKCRQSIVDNAAWCGEALGQYYELPCIFGDVRGVLQRGTFEPGATFESKFRAANRARLAETQFCYTHNDWCRVNGQECTSDADFSGLPCPDYSKAGNRQREEGPTNEVPLALITHDLGLFCHMHG